MKNILSLLSLCGALIAFNTPVTASAVDEEFDDLAIKVSGVKLEEEGENNDVDGTPTIIEETEEDDEDEKAAGDGKLSIEDGKELIEAGKNVFNALGDGFDKEDISVVVGALKTGAGVAGDVVKNVDKIGGVVGKITGIFGGGENEDKTNEDIVVTTNNEEAEEDI